MAIIIKGKNIEVTAPLKDYAEEKIGKLKERYTQILKTEIQFIVEKNPSIKESQTVEVTLFTKGPIFRATARTIDMYASIDEVLEKLERQLERHKGKVYRSKASNNQPLGEAIIAEAPAIEEPVVMPRIVKTKQFAVKPMPPEEAIMQMDLLGHDFFVFMNSETEEINVVYRRKDNDYGLIEPITR